MKTIEDAVRTVTEAILVVRRQCTNFDSYEGTQVDKNDHESTNARARLAALREIRGMLENLL